MLASIEMTSHEQLLLELVNRARANPSAEAARYGIDLNQGLAAGTIVDSPKQPLAPNQALINAAGLHSQDMLDRDYFAHVSPDGKNPGDRITAAGYLSSGWGENISWSGSTGSLNATTALLGQHEGLFKSPGHRTNILRATFDELGNGVKLGVFTSNGANLNASMVTEKFGTSRNLIFITGVAYTDQITSDSFYTIGEGIGGLTVVASNNTGGRFETRTGSSGGYSLAVPAGIYNVTFSGGGLTHPVSFSNINVTTENRKVDLIPPVATLQLTVSAISIPENGGSASATVTRSGSTTTSLVVDLGSSDTTEATVPATVTIPAGAASTTFVISAVDDLLADGNQSVVVSANSLGFASATITVTVVDNEIPKLTVTINPASISEEGGTATGTVERDGSTTAAVQVALTSSDLTEATVPASVTIPAGARSATFTVTAVDDTLLDGNQTVVIGASSTGLTPGSATVVVTDNETSEQPKLTFTVDPSSIAENGGSATARIERTGPTTAAITVALVSSDTTEATVPASIVIPAGAAFGTFTVTAVDDSLVDGTQTVVLTATSTGLTEGTATIAVTDNETPGLTLTLNPTTISERDGRSTATLQRSGPTTASLEVTLSSSDVSEATVPATVVIPAGQSSVTFVVTGVDDTLLDGDVRVTITANASGMLPASATVSVTDSERADLVLSMDGAAYGERAGTVSGSLNRSTSTAAALTVSLSSNNPNAVTVPATVTFAAGAQSVTFPIVIIDDSLADGARSATITASAANLTPAFALVTINDDDVAALTLQAVSTTVVEGGGTTVVTVSRNAGLNRVLTVTLASSDTTEALVPQQVSIPIGSLSTTFVVSAVDDSAIDGDQRPLVSASASGFQGAALQILVQDNDAPALEVTLESVLISERNGTTIGTVRRPSASPESLLVNLVSSNPLAATVPVSVTIPGGQTSTTFVVTAVDDALLDGQQSTVLSATAVGLRGGSQTLRVSDWETLSVVFSNASVLASAGSFSGSVIRSNSDVHSPITVQLSSSDTTALTVPTEVVIPAGESFVTFMVTPVAGFRNPVRTVSITATNAAYQSNSGILSVDDGLPKPWRNSLSVFDVNADNHITAMDALLVINHLNSLGSHLLGTPESKLTEYIDVNGDNFVSAIDALLVINQLNLQAAGEGESKLGNHAVDLAIGELSTNEDLFVRRWRRR